MAKETTAQAPDLLRVRLLGGFAVAVGGRGVPDQWWRLRKAAAVVKLLALAPERRLHREHLLDLLWPELEPPAAANNLRYALHVARRAIDPSGALAGHYLGTQGDLLVLCPTAPLWVDVEAFGEGLATARRLQDPAAYQTAIDLYTGDLLPDDRYEDWAAGRREELRGAYLAALVAMAGLYEARNEHDAAAAALCQAVSNDPLHEQAHVELMSLYARTGRQRDALRQYRRLRDVLRREMDVEPEPASRRLYETILHGGDIGAPASRTYAPVEPAAVEGPAVTNLPISLTSFVGRDQEIAEARRRLSAARLLTLTGAGGCGKTRLALQVAAAAVERYPAGVWLIELAPLADATLVPRAIAAVLGVREPAGVSILETTATAIGTRRLLLVLDNCEHLIEVCAELAEGLLRRCPNLQVLATSRAPLRVDGEVTYRVPSMALPAVAGQWAVGSGQWGPPPPPLRGRGEPEAGEVAEIEAPPLPFRRERGPGSERMRREGLDPTPDSPLPTPLPDAVRLFVERARAQQADLTLDEVNGDAIVQICRRLDGLPLAIELAAARVTLLSPAQIAARLDDRFRLLRGGSRTAPRRHQALQAAIDWSHDLLDPQERVLFRRLAVFSGGFTLDGVEAVVAGYESLPTDAPLLDLLTALIEKNLVHRDDSSSAPRFGMLETIRAYALDQLTAAGELEVDRRRHAGWCQGMVEERALATWGGPGQQAALDELDAEHDNLRAALTWALEQQKAEIAVGLAGALARFWLVRGHLSEGRRWLEAALARPGEVSIGLRAQALLGAGTLALDQGDYAQAATYLDEGTRLFRAADQALGVAVAVMTRGNVHVDLGEAAPALACYEEALALYRRLDQPLGVASALVDMANAYVLLDKPAEAADRCAESLALFRALGDRRGTATALTVAGGLSLDRGAAGPAAACYLESLALVRSVGDLNTIALCLEGLSAVAIVRQDSEPAARLRGAAETLRATLGAPVKFVNRGFHDRETAALQAGLGQDRLARLVDEGRAMTRQQALDYAVEIGSRYAAPPPAEPA